MTSLGVIGLQDPACAIYVPSAEAPAGANTASIALRVRSALDGIANRTEPPDPVDKDLYDLPPEELAQVPQVPGSLDAVLDALEADSDFLKVGGVFTDDLIETWVSYKRIHEVDEMRLRPHPWEFALYYDI